MESRSIKGRILPSFFFFFEKEYCFSRSSSSILRWKGSSLPIRVSQQYPHSTGNRVRNKQLFPVPQTAYFFQGNVTNTGSCPDCYWQPCSRVLQSGTQANMLTEQCCRQSGQPHFRAERKHVCWACVQAESSGLVNEHGDKRVIL